MSFKIAVIGAGSVGFTRTLFTDLMMVPEFRNIEVAFTDINQHNLDMVTTLCQRALDENVADLMKKYDQFRIKSPILTVDPTITVQIGLKEGVTPNSRYEVLEAQEENGKTIYKRIAVIKPVANRIWDNRYMASEELAYGSDFGATTFIKESGGDIIPGHLVRQIH